MGSEIIRIFLLLPCDNGLYSNCNEKRFIQKDFLVLQKK